jgi:hypothetical protein
METELRYYFHYYFSHRDISFGSFLSALSMEISKEFPDVNFTLKWAQNCDSGSQIASARYSKIKLRSYVQESQYAGIRFWDLLWNLNEVSMETFGITYAKIGTTPQELKSLSWRYLLKEYSNRVRTLKIMTQLPGSKAARKAFLTVDSMLEGIPMPAGEFYRGNENCYCTGGAYRMYRKTAEGHPIRPEDVGWSMVAHSALKMLIFPEGLPAGTSFVAREPDPTAIAITSSEEPILTPTPVSEPALMAQTLSGMAKESRQDTTVPAIWSQFVEAMKRQLPALSETAASYC